MDGEPPLTSMSFPLISILELCFRSVSQICVVDSFCCDIVIVFLLFASPSLFVTFSPPFSPLFFLGFYWFIYFFSPLFLHYSSNFSLLWIFFSALVSTLCLGFFLLLLCVYAEFLLWVSLDSCLLMISDLDSFMRINEIFIISFGAAPEFETEVVFHQEFIKVKSLTLRFCYAIECYNFSFSPRILFFYMQVLGEDLNREGLKKTPLRVAKNPPRKNKGKMELFCFIFVITGICMLFL
ncbi:hypothetical protein ACE6H2_002446 [Prunus campanulata]